MAAEPALTAVEIIRAAAVAGATDPQTDTWTPINLNDLPDKPPIQPTLGATGLVYPGKRHVFSGPPESAKTLAAYAILIQVARHGDTAVLVDFEMGAYDARQRLRELGAEAHEISRILYLEPDEPATPERIATLVAHKPSLVVVDAAAGAYQLEGLDDNKRGDVERLSSLYVTVFWRNGIATILLDHVVKNSDDRGRFVIGSERKLGGADVHLGFETVKPVSRGSSGHYKLVTHKDRGGYLKRGHLADLRLDSDPDTNDITWSFTEPTTETTTAGAFRPTGLMEKTSRYLEQQPEPVTRNTICDALGGTKKYVLAAITALVTEGYAAEIQATHRAQPVKSIRPYRENDESANPKYGSTMPAEPPNQLHPQKTQAASADLAQPSGGSLVREWFGSGSRTTSGSGGSVVRPPYGDDTTRPPARDPHKDAGWFDHNGNLANPPADLTWLDQIAPDQDDLFQ